jgi:hypothetical protein
MPAGDVGESGESRSPTGERAQVRAGRVVLEEAAGRPGGGAARVHGSREAGLVLSGLCPRREWYMMECKV